MNEQSNLIEATLAEILVLVDRDREKEVLTRRFGISGRKETLEGIGQELDVTRERVRQIEKVALERISENISAGKVSGFSQVEKNLVRILAELGRAARIETLAKTINPDAKKKFINTVQLLLTISDKFVTLTENNAYHLSVALKTLPNYTEKSLRNEIDSLVKIVKTHKVAISLDELYNKTSYETPTQCEAIANLSKLLATLGGVWGTTKCAEVNPRNIRDKVFIILKLNKKSLHYSDITDEIHKSNFRRNKITKQAVHNELIKDKRFVLIGRGIYALAEWGYKKGSVASVIEDILRDAGKPLSRQEIVKKVLEKRQVRESTILLNLQNKSEFIRVEKGFYTIKS